jgi:hypothetical protein
MMASVKVMRSYDYCHFEISLANELSPDRDPVEQTDLLRKAAARLADKAVEQYKVAKENLSAIDSDRARLENLRYNVERIKEQPESEWTPEEKAMVKKLSDRNFNARRRYDYEDDWAEEEGGDDQ